MNIPQNEENFDIFPLCENLGTSFVDHRSLLMPQNFNQSPIGMENFKSKSKKIDFATARKLSQCTDSKSVARKRWLNAFKKIKLLKDPWNEFHIEKYPIEKVVRHRYNPIKKEWRKDECLVRMETKQFSNGAMRACYRLKKLSKFCLDKSWSNASNNVAKCYISSEVPRQRYFEDVELQMDAKLWAEIYNKHKPPKKIDMFQVCILEFIERPNSPLYHLEHYMEGKYIKYNSNAGFVEDEHIRYTPHAFSHFTFECSNHELIVVDIQGVGDLYTDPQIHTASGKEYGDGNLGVKGFALFFYSHECNDICKSLGLSQFDLSPNELKSHEKIVDCMIKSNATKYKGKEEPISIKHTRSARARYLMNKLNMHEESLDGLEEIEEDSEGYYSKSPSPNSYVKLNEKSIEIMEKSSPFLKSKNEPLSFIQNRLAKPRHLTNKLCNHDENLDDINEMEESDGYSSKSPSPFDSFSPRSFHISSLSSSYHNQLSKSFSSMDSISGSPYSSHNDVHTKHFNRTRSSAISVRNPSIETLNSESSNCIFDNFSTSFCGSINTFNDKSYMMLHADHIGLETSLEPILGNVHLELCKYHELGRFVLNENYKIDHESAFFHLRQAANLGNIDGLVNLGKIYMQLPRDILSDYKVEENDDYYDIGFDYLVEAAEKGDKYSLFFVAKAFDTGIGLSNKKTINWSKAVEYYNKILSENNTDKSDDENLLCDVNNECDAEYTILARIAEIYLEGKHGVEANPQEAADLFTEAAEKAMQFGRGRLANKYYTMSEKASSQI